MFPGELSISLLNLFKVVVCQKNSKRQKILGKRWVFNLIGLVAAPIKF
jgi:hypothetical protein